MVQHGEEQETAVMTEDGVSASGAPESDAAARASRSDPARATLAVDLALQGGGAHGAFTWGVLDRLLEEPWLRIDGISGTSAGAMNAAVLVHGHARGGAEAARQALDDFWHRVADAARFANGHALQPQQLTQRIDRASGLLTNRTVPLLEDAEGTLWAGTNMGLVSFRRNRVALPAGIPIGVASNYAMARDNQGSVWIANSGQLWRMRGEQAQWVRGDLNDVHAALFDRADRLWMIGRHWLFALDGSDLSRYRLPETGSHTNALAIGADGAPLVAIAHRGLYRLRQGQWQPVVLPAPVQRLVPTTMTLDPQGRLWLGYADNLLARWDGHRLDVYTSADGLAVGNLTTLEATGEELLIGGELG